MRTLIFISGLLFLTNSFCSAQSADEKAVQKILDDQVYFWNKGDLENFVKGYWNNDSVMFIGSSGIVYGYQNTLNRYRKTYRDKTHMGQLKFTILHFNKLSPDAYFVVGRFHLTRIMGDTSGHFSLLFRKINGEWKIVSDHSS